MRLAAMEPFSRGIGKFESQKLNAHPLLLPHLFLVLLPTPVLPHPPPLVIPPMTVTVRQLEDCVEQFGIWVWHLALKKVAVPGLP